MILQTQVSGPFKIKQLVWRTGYDRNLIKAALKRLQKEGKVVPYDKCGDGTISYIKNNEVPKIEERRFCQLTEKARQTSGDQEFTASLIARSLDISFEEAGVWFKQAGELGILVKPREESHWARFQVAQVAVPTVNVINPI